jgi:hypothetical protein
VFPFWLCLCLGYDHPDHMLPRLTAGQLDDWQRVHAQYNLSPGRSDVYWAAFRADFINANWTDADVSAAEVAPYPHPLIDRDPLDEEISAEELRAKIMSSLARARG